MNKNRQVNKYLLEYLKKTIPNFQKKGKMFTCPQKHLHPVGTEELTANEFPEGSGKVYCFCPSCNNVGSLVDLYRRFSLDNNPDIDNSDIIDLIIEEFGIKINEEQEKLFELYEKLEFDMVPVRKDTGEDTNFGKSARLETDWQNKSHKNKVEWEGWINAGRNIGDKTGKLSGHLILDFDFVSSDLKKRIYEGKPTEKMLEEAKQQWNAGLQKIKEKIPGLDETTLRQLTFGGIHYFHIYDNEIPKTAFKYEGIHIDIEAEGGQVVCEPSIVGGQNRQIVGDKINPLPKELKEFILQNCQKVVADKKETQLSTDTGLSFDKLDGNCNNTFISLYGKLRKVMPIKSATYALNLFNGLLDDPMAQKAISSMSKEAEKYHKVDIKSLSEQIIDYFKLVQHDVGIRDLKEILNIERQDIEQALRYLLDEKKIIKVKKDIYRFITDVEWRTDFLSLGQPLPFSVPYINDYARFKNGSMIVLGGKTGTGKTHFTVNFIEKFVKQGITPKLITTEADSGIDEIALARGLKEGDFLWHQTSDPISVPFQDNDVTIIDWLTAKDGDYTKIGVMYQQLNDKLVDHGGLLIVFSQLRQDNCEFFARNHIDQFSSFAGKFLYPDKQGKPDYLHPYIDAIKIRRAIQEKYPQIHLEYIPETKELRIKK